MAPDQLLANPGNWRRHPKAQRAALAGALDSLGYIQAVIVNTTTGHVVDGHLRVEMALDERQPTVPVNYVTLTPAEEQMALATFDPLGALATTDDQALGGLLAGLQAPDVALANFLKDLALTAANPATETVSFEVQADAPTCPACGQKIRKPAGPEVA